MQLSENYLIELFKTIITNRTILEAVIKHLKYQYLPTEAYKKILKNIIHIFELNEQLPTIGVLNERLKDDSDALDLLIKIKKCKVSDKKEVILNEFESFLKEMRFKELYKKVGTLYNDEKKDEAITLLAKESEQIVGFSFKENIYTKIFDQFEKRQIERKQKAENYENIKIPFGIHPLDYYTRGGGSIGTSALFLARSGVGKTTLLRWIGLNAARLGLRVVHFQGEGTEQEALDAYDSAWTSVDLHDIEFGEIPKEKEKLIKQVNQDVINRGGEIFVIASEQFDNMYIEDCREHIIEIEKNYGKVHLVVFDYLEIFNTKGKYFNSETGERKRREDLANKITNIATELKLFAVTATQANDISPQKWNDPDYIMTRSDISEFKGALKPFSYFITLNQTLDEYNAGVIRMYNDKFRKYTWGQTYKIFQSLRNARFYDSKKTLEVFWDEHLKKPRK